MPPNPPKGGQVTASRKAGGQKGKGTRKLEARGQRPGR